MPTRNWLLIIAVDAAVESSDCTAVETEFSFRLMPLAAAQL